MSGRPAASTSAAVEPLEGRQMLSAFTVTNTQRRRDRETAPGDPDFLPELQFHSHDRVPLSIALPAGFALVVATAFAEPAIHRDTDPNHGEYPAATR